MDSRRQFLKAATAAATGAIFRSEVEVPTLGSFAGVICFFSKHLPSMDWSRMAKAVKGIGFGGIDLTVRPSGHVLPERAAEDLPKSVKAIQDEGLSVPMITTGLTSAGDPTAMPILDTAGRLGIPYFKPGYYKYAFIDVRVELQKAMADFHGLTDLSKQHKIQAGFHNHEGYIGAQLWDVVQTIDQLDPKWTGYYFDIRHAVAEGGGAGWKIVLNLVAPRIKMIAVKDSYWDKTTKGWRQIDCPLGEGMVDWTAYFKKLRQANFHGPISLHLEYEIKGATPSALEENTLAAAQKDFEFLNARLRETY